MRIKDDLDYFLVSNRGTGLLPKVGVPEKGCRILIHSKLNQNVLSDTNNLKQAINFIRIRRCYT